MFIHCIALCIDPYWWSLNSLERTEWTTVAAILGEVSAPFVTSQRSTGCQHIFSGSGKKLCWTESQKVSQTARRSNAYILNKITSTYWTRNTGRFAPSCSDCMARTSLFCLAAHQSDRPSEWSDPTGEPGSASWVAQISCYSYKHWLMFRVGQQQHWEFHKEKKEKNKVTNVQKICATHE